MLELDNKKIFDQYNIKNTKQRNIVFNILKSTDSSLTAEEIFIKTQDQEICNMNLSTVYRILNTFVSNNIVCKTTIGDNEKNVFGLNLGEHGHFLICLSCRKMIKIAHCPIEEYEQELQNKTKFKITGHRLEVYGYCPLCSSKNEV